MRTSRLAARLSLVVAATTTLVACGMGDAFVCGVGNGGNRFYATPAVDELVEQLAGNAVVPPVTDEMLATAFDAIAGRAESGDPDAALILFRLAEAQREAESD